MKIVLAILVLTLVPQIAVASIFDSFKLALSSITTSVEKMITTVAFDVKETIDCTLLALEHSLSITLFKEYNKKCNGVDNSESIDVNENLEKAVLHITSEHINEDFPEFESNAKTKMKRICGIPEDELDLDKIRKVLLHNSGRLRTMDDFLKKQLALLPNVNMMDSVLSKDTECSVEEVLNKIKALINTVKKVQDQKVGDEIGDILKEMLQLLNGDELVAASGETHLQSGFFDAAAVTNPANSIVVKPKIQKEENYYDTLTSYEVPLVNNIIAQSKPILNYDESEDISIAEDAVADFVNVGTDINERNEYIEPMTAEVIPNRSELDEQNTNDDDIDSIVKYIMAGNDNEDEEDSSETEYVTQSTGDNVLDFPHFPGLYDFMQSAMSAEDSEESNYPDNDLMRQIKEILRDQPHTELVMGNLRN